MNTPLKVALGASTFAAGALLLPFNATAATEHCPEGGFKVEVGGDSATVPVDADPGTMVCFKAGTRIVETTVGGDGTISNTDLTNMWGKPLGISYYVVYGGSSSGGSSGGSS